MQACIKRKAHQSKKRHQWTEAKTMTVDISNFTIATPLPISDTNPIAKLLMSTVMVFASVH